MRVVGWVSALSFLSVAVSGASIVDRCPDKENTSKRIRLKELTKVTLDRTPNAGGSLCTMVRLDQGNHLPVAKSYHGNPWERAGGAYAATLDEWKCDAPGVCWNMLPTGVYLLQTRETNRPSQKEEVARFLETVSFGPTEQDLENFSGSFVEYVQRQITMKPTYHREFFRRNAHPAWPFHKPGFATSLDPCAPDTAWRIYALGVDDIGKEIDIKKVQDRWEIRVDGFVRSMPTQLRILNNDKYEVKAGKYKICGNSRRRMQRGEFPLAIGGRCRLLDPEDVEISFPTNFMPPHMIDEPLSRLSNKQIWTETTTQNTARYYVRVKGIKQQRCSGLPEALRAGRKEPVFGMTAVGEWLIHEPRAVLNENSLDAPMLDGGRVAWASNQTMSCANVPRTLFNEKQCVLSSITSCAPGSSDVSKSEREGIVCGSPGEVGSDMRLGETMFEIASIPGFAEKSIGLPSDPNQGLLGRQREFVWSHLALNAKDQLRQRVAFALMQIFALPKSSIGAANRHTEIFLNYYDIFVRNAFGNYRDILLETTFNPLMAESLSFVASGSVGLSFATEGALNFPDENFAREIMQLFTISLAETNENGIPLLDSENKLIRTYDSDDIISMAKAWTGFQLQSRRTNIESADNRNRIDPMKLNPRLRDRFPKMGLKGKYVGDRYPLCRDLPKQSFLLKGAKYRLLGKNARPELVNDNPNWSDSKQAKRLVLRPNESGLYEQLCASDGGSCTYPAFVELTKTSRCSRSDLNNECSDIDGIRVVKVDSMYYEYVPSIPCTNYAFFNDGKKAAGKFPGTPSVCADPALPVASAACCPRNEKGASPACAYAGERVSFSLAEERCKAKGMTICSYGRFDVTDECPHMGSQWTDTPCQVQAKISSEGEVAIVHNTGSEVRDLVKENTPSFFRVMWVGGEFFTTMNNCGGGNCQVADGQCLCVVSVRDEVVFNERPGDKKPIIRALQIGYPEADLSRLVKTVVKGTAPLNGYTYYSQDGSCCDENTIFEASDESGRTFFMKNTKSIVDIENAPRRYSFRNPVQFNSIDPNEYSISDAAWETEAVIDHLLYHKNTAPFVAYRLIQRFGISNPTPRFVGSVATAFRRGIFVKGGETFGSAVYGCMEATIASIVLHREFAQFGNKFDPASGSLREPIVKVIAFMRAMGFTSSVPLVELDEMDLKIGQAPYEQPSVFSFFRSDYSPPGIASNSTLAAPEAAVMSAGRIVGILNGLFSLVDHGLVACDNGFGYIGCNNGAAGNLQDFSSANGDIGTMIDNWSLLLTAGRLTQKKKATIQRVIEGEEDLETARKLAVKLITTSPEFHTTNMADTMAKPESESQAPNAGRGQYKAVIHLALVGGCDSFNVLMPHQSCKELHADYMTVRESIAVPASSTLRLDGDTTGQPCKSFALHDGLPYMKQLYVENDLLFLANTGLKRTSGPKQLQG